MFWNVTSARDEISLRKWSPQLRTLDGVMVAKNALCWQQCFFFTHAVLHIYYKPGLKHVARGQHVARKGVSCGKRCFLGIFK